MNCYKSEAHSRIPAEIMLGRDLYMPFQIENLDIDMNARNI